MGVAGGGEGGLEDWVRVARTGVPEENLAGVGAADEEVGVERGKGDGENVGLSSSARSVEGIAVKRKEEQERPYLRVEDKLWSVQKVEVPDAGDSVRLVDGHRVLVVRRDEKFGKLEARGGVS